MRVATLFALLVPAASASAHEGHDHAQDPGIFSDAWSLLLVAGALLLAIALGRHLWQRRRARHTSQEFE